MLREVDAFWACRAKYPDIKLHVHHDATGRSTFEVGKDAKLMLFYASYFNPDLKRAVTIILNLRALPGSGSAAATARALAVNLEDMGLYKIKSSPDAATEATSSAATNSIVLLPAVLEYQDRACAS